MDGKIKVALCGDVALELLAPYFRDAGFEVYVPAGFGAWRREILDPSSPLEAFKPDFVFDVTSCDAALEKEVPGFYDERMRALASMPYSIAGVRAIVDEFAFVSAASARKALAVDADGTLWSGILSEDGPGALCAAAAFQRGLLRLRDRGAALILATKNDPPADGCGFMPAGMPLADGDFASLKIGWGAKSAAIAGACRELNIGTDAVAFLDDNSAERAEVSAALPGVAVVPWRGWGEDGPSDAAAAQLLRRLETYFFADGGRTREDALRAADYASRRRAERERFATAAEYLDSLGIWVEPFSPGADDIPRLVQMSARTNQFNATTVRRTEESFAALLADPSRRVFAFRSGDRFAEQGTVCYIVCNILARRIEEFVMSCRAMGRSIEFFAYRHVCRELGFEPEIDYSPSAKNAPFKAFLDAGARGEIHCREGRA